MKRHNIYSLMLAILEQLALVAAVLRILPEIGINIPVWGLLLMMVALCAYSVLSYRLGKKAMERSPLIWPAVGSKGRATTPLAPSGYALIGTELWKASSTGADIDRGTEVVIVRVEGTQLFVTGRNDTNKLKNGWVVLP
jgi:membrane-bound ClpP family serine protease